MKDVTGKPKKVNLGQWFKKNSHHKIESKFGRKWYIALILLLMVYYYIYLPALNYAVIEFWMFIGIAALGVLLIEFMHDSQKFKVNESDFKNFKLPLKYKIILTPFILALVIGLAAQLIFSPIFMANKYAKMIDIKEASFEKEFPETDVTQIPLMDRDTSERLGNRKLGSLTNVVSQFEVASDYTQINISGKPYRVTPLEYAGFFKWVNNFQKGIPHYLQVDTVTGEVEVKTPSQPIKYSNADKFNRNIRRHLRFNYPFSIFSQPAFEVDDQGNPYYIATTFTRNFFIKEPEANGVVTVNAMTGETKKYSLKDAPKWIDRIHNSDLILHQITMNGLYKNGFWNSLFSKTGVTEPTEGYNYLPMNDDLYLYTGITSVSADESNIGFVLVNLRTKEAKQYTVDAAEEFSAMKSAEGSVQETEYTATFPLLINIKGKPMYILTLKDNSGLIRKYALVDVANYSKVYVENNVQKLMAAYAQDNAMELGESFKDENIVDVNGTIEEIQAVVVDGQTVYYFMLSGNIYQAPIKLHQQLPFVKSGQEIQLKATKEGKVTEIVKIGE